MYIYTSYPVIVTAQNLKDVCQKQKLWEELHPQGSLDGRTHARPHTHMGNLIPVYPPFNLVGGIKRLAHCPVMLMSGT